VKAIHVATVPPQLDLTVLEVVMSGIESALLGLGADRIWVDVDGPALAVMAELPEVLPRRPQPTTGQVAN
jgi:hypothetical protein